MKHRVTNSALFFFLLAVAVLAFAPDAYGQPAYQQGVSQSSVVDGVLNVKLAPEAVRQIEGGGIVSDRGAIVRTNAQGVVQTGVPAVDRLATQFGVAGMTRIFRPAGADEARHRAYGLHRWYTVRVRPGASLQAAVEAFGNSTAVTTAEYRLRAVLNDGYEPGARRAVATTGRVASSGSATRMDVTNDPLYEQQWHYNNTGQNPPGGVPGADISLPEAHNLETGNTSVIVAVHDAGIDSGHEDLANNVWVNEDEVSGGEDNGYDGDVNGYNFFNDQGQINPGTHGTHVAGTVGAVNNNGTGVAGVAGGNGTEPGVRLMSLQIFDPNGGGAGAEQIAESLTYAADNGAHISQNSWGYGEAGIYAAVVREAIDYYLDITDGIVLFSAGNTGSEGAFYPGAYTRTVAVAATGIDDQASPFTTYGEWVDIAAPGGVDQPYDGNDVLSTLLDGEYGYLAGTSMAAPHASGVAALILSASPGLDGATVRETLTSTADVIDVAPRYEGKLGSGRLNAYSALLSLDPGDATPPSVTDGLAASLITGGDGVELAWAAPYDDEDDPGSGPVASYQVAYSTDGPITDSTDFADATRVPGTPVPAEPGTEQGTFATGLAFNTQYWFAVRAIDDNANTSLSASVSITTRQAPVLSYSPELLEATLGLDEVVTRTLTLSNDGAADTELNFSFPAFAADEARNQAPGRLNDVSAISGLARYEKGDPDPHPGVGHAVTLGAGGPDAYGYEWIDSNEEGGPSYNFIDISEVGQEADLTDDFGEQPSIEVSLPFSFNFYGVQQRVVRIDNNGFLSFGEGGNFFQNVQIPNTQPPNGVIAPFWEDLAFVNAAGRDQGAVYYYNDEANDRFIVQWDRVVSYNQQGPDGSTFQAILSADGSILFQYDRVNANAAQSTTVGVEGPDGSEGLQVAFNTTYVEEGLAVAIAAEPAFISDVSPVSGTIVGGDGTQQEIEVTFSPERVTDSGVYEDALSIETNDPDNLFASIPAQANIELGDPAVAARPGSLDFGGTPAGGRLRRSFYLVNVGAAPVTVSELSFTGDTEAFEALVFPPSPAPPVISVGDSTEVNVAFTPEEQRAYAATLTAQTEAGVSAEVQLMGEGQPAPAIAVSPDSLSPSLEIGTIINDQISIGNEGNALLTFRLRYVLEPGADVTPADVAAVASGGEGSGEEEAVVSSASGGGSGNASATSEAVPLSAADATYQIDDGTAEDALSLRGPFGSQADVMWMNGFRVLRDVSVIEQLHTTFGWPGGQSCALEAGADVRAYVYDDPNNDGDPSDAVVVAEEGFNAGDVCSNTFSTVTLEEPVEVEGVFFVAILWPEVPQGGLPVPFDLSSEYQGASWLVGSVAGQFNDENLGQNFISPTTPRGFGLLGNIMLRASASAASPIVRFNPSMSGVPPGAPPRDITVTYDATELEAGRYEGAILIDNNDPTSDVASVPLSLDVLPQSYPFEVAPEAISETIDRADGDLSNDVLNEDITVENTADDSERFRTEVRIVSNPTIGLQMNFPSEEAERAYQRHAGREAATNGGETAGRTFWDAPPQLSRTDHSFDGFPVLHDVTRGTGFGYAQTGGVAGNTVEFAFEAPRTLRSVAPSPVIYAGDFAPGNREAFYVANFSTLQLMRVNAETGQQTAIGELERDRSDLNSNWADFAGDPTTGRMYASTGRGLYTIDVETAETHFIGKFGGSLSARAIAIDSEGQLYAHALADPFPGSSEIYAVNKETAAVELIGETGFVANFSQGMDFDLATGTLYMTTYNQAEQRGELRSVDRDTGEATLLSPLGPEGALLTYLALPSSPGLIAVDPEYAPDVEATTLVGGGEVTFPLTIDASGRSVLAGQYEAELAIVAESRGGNPEEVVPINLTVDGAPMVAFDTTAIDFGERFVGAQIEREVEVFNDGTDVLEVGSVALSSTTAFEIVDGQDGSFSLVPGESAFYTVRFAPVAAESYSSELVVASNAPDDANASVALTGQGLPSPDLAIDPQRFDLRATIGQTYDRTLTIANEGEGPLAFALTDSLLAAPGEAQTNATITNVLIDEDFETQALPEGWERTSNGSGWTFGRYLSRWPFYIPAHTAYAAAVDVSGNDGSEDYLITGPIDFPEGGRYTVAFDSYFTGEFGQEAYVEVSTDGGETFEVVQSIEAASEWTRRTVDLSAYDGAGSVRIAFHTDDQGNDENSGWAIDDVEVRRGLELLSIDPTSGTVAPGAAEDVNLTVDAAGLTPGTYEIELTVASDDPTEGSAAVPLVLEVVEELTVTVEPGPDSTRAVAAGQEVLVPITVAEQLGGFGVESYALTLSWADAGLFEAVGVETEGTLSEGLGVAVNVEEAGQISVAATETAGAAEQLLASSDDASGSHASGSHASGGGPVLFDLEGTGTLLYVRLRASTARLDTSAVALESFVFNEGAPAVGTRSTSYAVELVYGDASLNGRVGALDTDAVLRHVIGAATLAPVALEAAEVSGNGEVGAFDASLIFDRVLGRIECFPVEAGCDAGGGGEAVATARTALGGDAGTAGQIAWGTPQDVKAASLSPSTPTSNAPTARALGRSADVGSAGAEDASGLVRVPLHVETPSSGASSGGGASVRAVELETRIDPEKASIERVEASGQLPEGWRLAHRTEKDGTLRLAMAGPSGLPAGSAEVAVVTLRWKKRGAEASYFDKQLTLTGEARVNESAPQPLARAELRVVPETFALPGNYPNPFGRTTQVAVDLPAAAEVTLEVFDALGRRVVQATQQMEAGTGREFEVRGAGLASGVYFYRVTAEEEGGATHTGTGKMILVR